MNNNRINEIENFYMYYIIQKKLVLLKEMIICLKNAHGQSESMGKETGEVYGKTSI